jgi:signal transduction histidine kinase/FixJ family two-component response regulator
MKLLERVRSKFFRSQSGQKPPSPETESTSGLGLYSYNVKNDSLTMNKAMFMMLNMQPTKHPIPCSSLNMHPEDRAQFEVSLNRAIESGQSWLHEFRVVNRHNTVSTIRISAEIHRSRGCVSLDGGAMDITVLVNSMEAAKEMSSLKIRHLDDMKHQTDMNSMIRTICHEIRNPLQGVISNAEIIQEVILTDTTESGIKQICESVKDILVCTLYQAQTLDDLINFESLNLKTANIDDSLVDNASIDELISSVVSMFKEACTKKGVTLSIASTLGISGTFHVKNIQTVLINLTSNAVKFTNQGSITIIPDYASPVSNSAAVVRIQVQDTGTGVDDSVRERIFSSYGVKADNMIVPGSGLGLRTCKLIAEGIGGSIGFDDSDIGSVFKFTFPIKNIQKRRSVLYKAEPRAVSNSHRDPSAPKKRVLLADDNPIIRKVYQVTLKEDFDCDVAKDGHEALFMYEQEVRGPRPYDLLVLDYNMPVRKGIDVARIIRKNAPHLCTPIVFVTGEIGEQIRTSIETMNNVHLMLKPVAKKDMITLFHTILDADMSEGARDRRITSLTC